MNKVKRILIGVCIVLLSVAVGATSVYEITDSPVCDASGTRGQSFSTSQAIPFNHVSYFYNADLGDSVEIKVKNGGDGNNNFKFISFDNQFKNATIVEAQSSSASGVTFVAHINQILVVKDTNGFYAYKYDPNSKTPVTQITLNAPSWSITDPITKFIPFYWDDVSLWVGISAGSQSAIFQYEWPTAQPWEIDPVQKGQIMTHEYTTLAGTDTFFYDKAVPRIQHFSTDDSDYVDYLLGPCVTKAGVKISAFALRQDYFGYASMEGTRANGTFYQIQGTTTSQTTIPLSTFDLKGYTDSVSNVVIVASAFFGWTTIIADGTFITTHTDDTEITLAGIKGIALSGNKAVVLYSGKIVYYQHPSQGRIEKIKERTFTSSEMDLTTEGTWRVSLTCKCMQMQVKSFSCFSSSMDCMVVTQDTEVDCNIINDITP